jgi:hypothetical protein
MNYGLFYEVCRRWLASIPTRPFMKDVVKLAALPDLRLYRMRLYNSRDGPMR